ncbi:MAG: hypothetical protein GMKNLPBB_00459 [Myxococcota bacterium]|nr:hypothetical protein [Myxococcota bacterium]
MTGAPHALLRLDDAVRPAWCGDGLFLPDLQLPQWRAPGTARAELLAPGGGRVALLRRGDDGGWTAHPDLQQAAAALLHEDRIQPRRPPHWRMGDLYQQIPGRLRFAARRMLANRQWSADEFPRWPLDGAMDALRHLLSLAGEDRLARLAWPEGKRWVLALTHDLDTPQSYSAALRMVRAEARLGMRSTCFMVGRHLREDDGGARSLRDWGAEIGLHGADHGHGTPFETPDTIGAALDELGPVIGRLEIRGFRAPSLLTTGALFAALAGRFEYDSSTPSSDRGGVAAPVRGCGTVFPFWRREGVLELPPSLPLDDTLRLRGSGAAQAMAFWEELMERIAARGGLAVLTNHPEPHLSGDPRWLEAYEEFLRRLSRRADVWISPLAGIARWVKQNAGE